MITSTRVRGDAERSPGRYGIITVTYSALETMLNLPQGWRIVSVHDDFSNNTIKVKVASDTFKETSEGAEISSIVVGTGEWVTLNARSR